MPRPYPAEFRLRAVALVRSGKRITTTAQELGISAAILHKWVHQDRVDRGEKRGVTTKESAELARANKRIRELEMEMEMEIEILRRASKILGKDAPHPKGSTR
jgi:transposase